MDDNQIQELKLKINQFIWENAPPAMTIEEAEKASIDLLEAMYPNSTSGFAANATQEET